MPEHHESDPVSQSTRKQRVGLLFVGILVMLVVAVGLRTDWQFTGARLSDAAIAVSADSVDATNEGRLVSVNGRLSVHQPPEDPQLGLQVPEAVILVREVQMLQWQEACEPSPCSLHTTWSSELIDSKQFSEPAEENNPDRFPIASDRFVGREVRLGAFVPDPDLLVSSIGLTPRPISLDELSNNLAASFSISDNALFSGNDPEHPAVGDLRIRYSIVASGKVSVTGIQQSSQLIDPAQPHRP